MNNQTQPPHWQSLQNCIKHTALIMKDHPWSISFSYSFKTSTVVTMVTVNKLHIYNMHHDDATTSTADGGGDD